MPEKCSVIGRSGHHSILEHMHVPYDTHTFATLSNLVTMYIKKNEVMFCCHTEYYGKVV